jgi:capsular polysaccharide biosynthesis protein
MCDCTTHGNISPLVPQAPYVIRRLRGHLMKPPKQVPRPADYLRMLRDSWIVIVCATVLSVGAGWLARQTSEPVYQAGTRIFVVTPGGAVEPDVWLGGRSAMGRAFSIQQLAQNPQVAKRTIDQLDLNKTPADLAKSITAVVHNSELDIYVNGSKGDDAELTRNIANSVTYNLIELSREMADLDKSDSDVVLLDAASGVSDRRSSLTRYLLLGGLLGFGLSVIGVVAVGLVRDKVLGGRHIAHIVDETVAERNA